MSEFKFAVPPYAMLELADFVTASAPIEDKKKIRKLRKAWEESDPKERESWTVTISPPKNIVHVVVEDSKKRKTAEEPRRNMER